MFCKIVPDENNGNGNELADIKIKPPFFMKEVNDQVI
jgi:hypothetical protein